MRPISTRVPGSSAKGCGFEVMVKPLSLETLRFAAWSIVCALMAVALLLPCAAQGAQAVQSDRAAVAANYGRLPLSFEANRGQLDPRVKFVSRGDGYSLFLTEAGAVLSLSKRGAETGGPSKKGTTKERLPRVTDVLRLELASAVHNPEVMGADQLAGTANYFIGSDRSKWHEGVPTFGKVRYAGVFPGVDLVYYGNQRQLEYDFVVAPHADAKPIRLKFAGAKALKLDAEGNLYVIAADGEITFNKPVVYQEIDGRRQAVEGRFALLERNTAGFTVGAYDTERALVIDPVLVYSSFLGGSFEDEANAIAVDGSGNAYVTGITVSSDFPVTAGAFQSTNDKTSNDYTAFVTKLNATGTALVYSTYLGGSSEDIGSAIAIDGSGDAYVTGQTSSSDFPVTPGALQTTFSGGGSSTGFVTELNASGTALVYSTYLGGLANAIAVNGSGDAYVTGIAGPGFPVTPGAFQTTNNATGATDTGGNAFVAELNAAGSALVYGTYLGGSFGDEGYAIALDGFDNAYVAGWTGSTDFPVTTGAVQTVNNDPGVSVTQLLGNAFVAKLNATGTGLFYATYLGGSTGGGAARISSVQDEATGIAVDGSGNAYVAGFAYSTDFPTSTGAFQTTNNAGATGNSNAFVSKLNADGTGLIYSTYLGGSEGNPATGIINEGAYAVAVDGSGAAIVVGTTSSDDFPVSAGAFQVLNRDGFDSGFVARLNPAGTALLYSTYLGGSTSDGARGLALDGLGNAYVTGLSDSVDFPISAGAFQTKDKTTAFGTCFVAKLDLGFATTATTTTVTSSADPQGAGLPFTITATVAGASGVPTGSAIFSVDGKKGTAIQLTGGVAKATPDFFIPGTFGVGTHTIVVTYSPDAAGSIFASSSGTLTQTITTSSPIATTTTLTSSKNPQTAGLPVTFTVTVTPASGTIAPTGTVTTTVDGGTGPTLVLSNGTASITTSALAAGTHTIVATYAPDTNSSDYLTSSATLTQTINAGRTAATLTSPMANSTLGASNVTFQWTAGSGNTGYALWLGIAGPGSSDIYASSVTTATSVVAPVIPAKGVTIYARLFSLGRGGALFNDYVFTEGTPTAAALVSPTAGSVLGASNVVFTWSAGTNVNEYVLWLGLSGPGSSSLYTSGDTTALSATVPKLPAYGATIYARLYSIGSGGVQYNDYTFTEGTMTLAAMSSPTPGSTLGATNIQFTWSAGTNVNEYGLWLGLAGPGSSDLYASGPITTLSTTVPRLPAHGATIYARLFSIGGGGVQFIDYTYTEP